jgi:hypothetical protein
MIFVPLTEILTIHKYHGGHAGGHAYELEEGEKDITKTFGDSR